MKWLAVALGALVIGCSPVRNGDVFAGIEKSVGALYAEGGDHICTVTAVGKHGELTVFATAQHCVADGRASEIRVGGEVAEAIRWQTPKDAEGAAQTDMALLLADLDVPVVPLGSSSELVPGDPVVMIGYPWGAGPAFYGGYYAGRFVHPKAGPRADYLILQILASPGMSGSAIVDYHGQVVGIFSGAFSGPFGSAPVYVATPINMRRNLVVAGAE